MTLHRASRAHEFAKVLVDRLGAAVALVVLSPIIAATLSASGSAWGRRSSSVRFERVATGAVHHPEVQDDGDAGGVLLCRPGACRGIQMAPGTTIPWFTPGWCAGPGSTNCPSLINILRGEMSFIGPWPLMVRYIPRYTAEQRRRHSVLPGISGWPRSRGPAVPGFRVLRSG